MEGAPAALLLFEFIKQKVLEVEVPWLAEADAGVYLPVAINVIHTSAPAVAKQATGRPKATTKIQ